MMNKEELELYLNKFAASLLEQIKYSQELTRENEKLKTELYLADEDADRLATELELAQDTHCKCIPLSLHYIRKSKRLQQRSYFI